MTLSVRKLFLLLLLALLTGITSLLFFTMNANKQANAQTTDVTTGLISYWTFDNTVQDATGTNHGTFKGGTPSYQTGRIGQALNFDGSNDFVDFPDTQQTISNGSNFTISAWIYPHVNQENNTDIYAMNYSSTGGGVAYSLGISGAIVQAVAGNGTSTIVDQMGVNLNEWSLVTTVFNGSTVTAYVNGVSSGSPTTDTLSGTVPNRNPASSEVIGAGYEGLASYFDGLIDDVRVYNRALTQADIQALYSLSSSNPSPTVSLSASPSSIAAGQSSTLTWSSTDATSCSASGGWSGTKSLSGSQAVSPTTTTTYTLSCTGAGGTSQKSTTVTVTSGTDTTAPVRSNGSPSGTLPAGTIQTTLSLSTNENANCRYSTTAGTNYSSMTNTFTSTGGSSHSTTVSGLSNGQSYTYNIRCQDGAGNANTNDFGIAFSVAQSQSSGTQTHIKVDKTHPAFVAFRNSVGATQSPGTPNCSATLTANSLSTFNNAVAAANPGQCVALAPGSYNFGVVTIPAGSSGITIMPQSGGQVTFTGTTEFRISAPDTTFYNLTFSMRNYGIIFYEGSNRGKVFFSSFNLFAENTQVSYPTAVDVRSNDVEIAYNDFDNMTGFGFAVVPSSSHSWPDPQRTHVHHNNFTDYRGDGGVEGSVGHIGDGTNANWPIGYDTHSLIEYNYIRHWTSDPEIFSVKANNNIVRYNYIENEPGNFDQHLNVRVGHNNVFYGNWSEGNKFSWRVSGDNNYYLYNYVRGEDTSYAAFYYFAKGGNPTAEFAANDSVVKYNVLENNLDQFYTITNGVAPFKAGPTGNVQQHNYYLDKKNWITSNNVNTSAKYWDQSGEYPWATFIANNTLDDIVMPWDAGQNAYGRAGITIPFETSMTLPSSVPDISVVNAPAWYAALGFSITGEPAPPSSTPTPSAPFACHTLDSTPAIPSGFAASYNPFTTQKELLLSATCNTSNTSVTLGNGNMGSSTNWHGRMWVWNKGYQLLNNTWQAVTYTCSGEQYPVTGGSWCRAEATGTLNVASTAFLGYTCQWHPSSSSYKCGCTDAACTTPRWHVQQVQR